MGNEKRKRQSEKARKSLFQRIKKILQNYEIKDILKELNIPSESYFVTNLSILVDWIYENDVFKLLIQLT
jgi:predicted DNA-binding antitoxin AbrB/MazE fold protein